MNRDFIPAIAKHFDRLLAAGTANFGPAPCKMWLSSIDTRTGRYPENDIRPEHLPKRCYRSIDAPKGSSIYWDQPQLIAAHNLSRITGDPKYAAGAETYVTDFLERCVARNGVFLWGNHYYWNVVKGATVKFRTNEEPFPVDPAAEDGDYHEARPIPPAWEIFRNVSPEKTANEIVGFCRNSVFDDVTGGFNRHADGKKGCAFLESGGIIVEALAWLSSKTGDPEPLRLAQKVAEFSFSARDKRTGLVVNNPTVDRWDRYTATTEIGLWGGSLLRAAAHAPECPAFVDPAASAVAAYLEYGFDSGSGKYFGRLRVADGSPIVGPNPWKIDNAVASLHQPGDFSEIWRPLFPAHDYPLQFAECCLSLYERIGGKTFRTGCDRWADTIERSIGQTPNAITYAEHYGRAIHFLWRYGRAFDDRKRLQLADRLANLAVERLSAHGYFRSHTMEDRCDAIDGPGYLFLALLALETDDEPEMFGSGW